jgi:hypothetical protein
LLCFDKYYMYLFWQVRKYFGGKARTSFSDKVLWMNRQHAMHDLSADLLPVAALSPNSVSFSRSKPRRPPYKKNKISPIKLRQKTGEFRNIQTLHDFVGGKHRRDSVSSVGSLNSVSSLGSCGSIASMTSGVSLSNKTHHQFLFDDHNDMDADMYVNHENFKRGACLDIENLLNHLNTQKGKKDYKNKLILETMYKREEVSSELIKNVRAATPDVSAMPTQVRHTMFV